ncbi:MAG: hypothetical protein H7099_06675 [Gemmatimonadaceae bacterium]|nr:hypothetical protein [Gemmatimonadaceae bacterium]
MSYGTIVVCGGGCYGGYYVRQLARARAAGALRFDRIVVVDRDAQCAVAQLVHAIAVDDLAGMQAAGWSLARSDASSGMPVPERGYRGLPITVVTSDWQPFFTEWFQNAIVSLHAAQHDAVVPSPLMPHLLSDWIESRVRVHRPDARVQRVPMSTVMETPWQRDAPDLAHYASFATWMCPINCIEPPRCPETRGPRDWTMPAAVRTAVDDAARLGSPYDVVALFQTSHRAFGVGMFDVSNALAADASIMAHADRAHLRLLVASVSHCHGALAELVSERGEADRSAGASSGR